GGPDAWADGGARGARARWSAGGGVPLSGRPPGGGGPGAASGGAPEAGRPARPSPGSKGRTGGGDPGVLGPSPRRRPSLGEVLGDADLVAERVAHGHVAAVGAGGRLLGDLDAGLPQPLVLGVHVVALQDHPAGGAELG